MHSTQFAIREPKHGLFEPVLRLAAETVESWPRGGRPFVKIAGLCGHTPQAVREAELARDLGYHAGLLSLGAWRDDDERRPATLHDRGAGVAPGRLLSATSGRRPAAQPPFLARVRRDSGGRRDQDRPLQPLPDIRRGARCDCERARRHRALHRQRDNIIVDLLTPFGSRARPHFIVGGLLGQWGVWTERAVALLDEIKRARRRGGLSAEWLRRNVALTDANAALFDPAHGFAGCLPGIHEVLRRQGICETTACLDPRERLSPGQAVELDRVSREYAWLVDDAFVRKNLDRWLA